VIRTEARMQQAKQVVQTLREEYRDVALSDTGMWTNQNLSFTRALGDMLIYAQAILDAAILRKESRGSHYRPDYPERIDDPFLKTTIAKYDPAAGAPIIEYEDVPLPLLVPRARTYGKVDNPDPEKKQVSLGTTSKEAAVVSGDAHESPEKVSEGGGARTRIEQERH
jgi:succinate dehydrogenase / fumarate reductase flavoprotein subunit